MLKKAKKERLIWLDIMITLAALQLMAYFYYGIRAAALGCLCAGTSLAAEIISLRIMGRKFTADDLSCTSDALILSLMLPAVIDYKLAVFACIFAVVIAKNVFGGRRNMIFSPAAAAYVFLLTSWGKELLMYPQPHTHTGISEKPDELVYSASHTLNLTGKLDLTDFEILMGNFNGPAGSVSILLLLIAAVMLVFRGDISAGAFLGTMSGTAVLALISPIGESRTDAVGYSIVSNMVLFAAVYIVADKRIAPHRDFYAFFYGFFIAVCAYVIVLTTAKENAIIMVTVLFTPAALAFRNLEKKIENAVKQESEISLSAVDNAEEQKGGAE